MEQKEKTITDYLAEVEKEINEAPTELDFHTLIAQNQKYFVSPFSYGKGTIEVKNKKIGIVNIEWPNRDIKFIFTMCTLTRIIPTNTPVVTFSCEIEVVQCNNIDNNYLDMGSTIRCLNLNNDAFKEAQFYNSKIKLFKTSRKPVTISDINFGAVQFQYIYDFKNIRLGSNVHFEKSKFVLSGEDYCESEFRHIKKEAADHKNETLAHFFASWEVKSRYHKQKFFNNPYEKSFGFLYWLLNDFGIRPYLPLFYIILVSGLIMLFDSSDSRNHNAFVFLITPLKILNKDIIYKCYSIYTQSFLNLLGAVLWFFTILGLRKTFKVDKI